MNNQNKIKILENAMENQFKYENQKISAGWFMIIVGALVLLFSYMLKIDSVHAILGYIGILASIGMISYGIIEMRNMRELLKRIELDIKTLKTETISGIIEEIFERSNSNGISKYFLKIENIEIRITKEVFESFSIKDEIILIRSLYSGTIFEVVAK